MLDQLNDGFSVHTHLVNKLGMAQIEYWCQQLECSEDELLNAVRIVGFDAEDLCLYLHHMQ